MPRVSPFEFIDGEDPFVQVSVALPESFVDKNSGVARDGTGLAVEISDALLQRRLISCAKIGPVLTSRYWWEGEIQTDEERVLTVTSKHSFFDDIAGVIEQRHPYDISDIQELPIIGINNRARAWAEEIFSEAERF